MGIDKPVDVAVGILLNDNGAALVSKRRADSDMPGAWEFPGGKLNSGESRHQALVRELAEELAIQPRYTRYLCTLVHDYGDYKVQLHCWRILSWEGDVTAAENQVLEWVPPDQLVQKGLLPADKPIVNKLLADSEITSSDWQATARMLF